MTADNFRHAWRVPPRLAQFHERPMRPRERRQSLPLPKKTRGFIEHGHVDPLRLLFVPEHFERLRDVAGETVREN